MIAFFPRTDETENICENIIRMDDNVLFAGIVDRRYCLVEYKFAGRTVLTMSEQHILDKFHHLLVSEFETKLCSFSFVAIHKDQYLELVFPFLNCILCVICTPNISDEILSEKILELIARHDARKNPASLTSELWGCHAV